MTEPAAVYVVEQYVPGLEAAEGVRFVIALREAAGVRLACSLLFPEDDLCLHVLAAASSEAAAGAADTAGIDAERIVSAAVWLPPSHERTSP